MIIKKKNQFKEQVPKSFSIKFRVIALLLPLLTLIAPNHSNAQLAINPNNPHYFIYNGKPIHLLTYGYSTDFSAVGSPNKYNNNFVVFMASTRKSTNPYNGRISGGWNEGLFNDLKSVAEKQYNAGVMLGVIFNSTPFLEPESGNENCKRWCSNPYNERNGGPIPDDGNGKDEFYTFYDYGNEIAGPYDNSWPWQKKNQYLQEALIKKCLNLLAAYPNVHYVPMYEIDDIHGSNVSRANQWFSHYAWLIRKYQPERLIGTWMTAEFLANDDADYALVEGPSWANIGDSKRLKEAYWSYNKPLLWMFLYPGSPRFEGIAKKDPLGKMINSLIYGMHPATLHGSQGTYVAGESELALSIQNFVKTVETWCDEPGQEITSTSVPDKDGSGAVDLPPGGCNDNYDNTTGPIPVRINNTSLPAAFVNLPYNAKLTADGGVGAKQWSVILGDLPPGITRTDNKISGTPTQEGDFTFTIKVEAEESADSATFTIKVIVGASPATIINISPAGYTAITLVEDALIYFDRAYKISLIPTNLLGATLIQTRNDDKASTGSSFLNFNAANAVEVYIGVSGGNSLSWMDGWSSAGQTVKGSHGPTYTLFVKEFSSGEISLGGNEGSGSNMYTVFVSGKGTNPTSIAKSYLYENFSMTVSPNPFITSVTISLFKQKKHADLLIYNLSGELIKEYTGIEGTSITWRTNGLSNGVYLIKAVVGQRQYIRKVTLQK